MRGGKRRRSTGQPRSGYAICDVVLQVLKRMMGLEPTTFCMASASDRSRPFAQLVCLQDLCPSERTRANPSERRTLPFLPRPVRRPRPPLRLAGHPGPSALELLAAIVDVHPRVPIRTRLQRGRALIVGRKSIGGLVSTFSRRSSSIFALPLICDRSDGHGFRPPASALYAPLAAIGEQRAADFQCCLELPRVWVDGAPAARAGRLRPRYRLQS
jgi:hypothetical protein